MFLQCPKCGKRGGNRLQRGGVLEHLLSCVYIYPYRCDSHWLNRIRDSPRVRRMGMIFFSTMFLPDCAIEL